jgi:eukaryotic-like serine/threonine-protein kinase
MQSEHYQIEALAGEGGMGVVYRALHRQTGRRVAIKMLHKRGERERELMLREAEILASVEHPGVVRYIEQGEAKDGTLFVVLEWLDGEDLEALLQKRCTLSIEETLCLAERVASALAAVHQLGIIHRDIKPSNLFLPNTTIEQTKILDFGIAHTKAMQTISPMMKQGKIAMVGTLGYMAPEQARGEQKLTTSADIFSLGCVLFRCLTGEGPFDGAHEIAILAKILLDETPKLRSLKPEIPEALEHLVSWMLHKNPAERPRSGKQLLELLQELRGSLEHLSKEPTVELAPLPQTLTEREQGLFCVLLLQREPRAQQRPEAPKTLALAGQTIADAQAFYLHKTTAEPLPTIQISWEADFTENTYPKSLRQLQNEVKQEAERFGGRLEPLADGSALVFFVGHVATDMAQKAARCARALQQKFPAKGISLATGRAEVTARWPVGEVIDRAVSLLAHKSQAIAIDNATAGLLGARFELRAHPHYYELADEYDAFTTSRTLLGKKMPCFGRDQELWAITALYEECISQRQAKSLLITAPEGAGKSRLREEVIQRLSRHPSRPKVIIGLSEENRQEEPYGVLLSALRRVCGFLEEDSPQENTRRFIARIGRYLKPEKAPRVLAFLAELLGLTLENECRALVQTAQQDPVLLGDQIRRSFADWLTAESRAHPTLLIIEDWHWCDSTSAILVNSALSRLSEQRLFLLLFARPDALQKSDSLPLQTQHLALKPLTKEAALKFIHAALGDEYPHAQTLWERSEGNAFYLEELMRSVTLQQQQEFPETMLAMVQARLGTLSEEQRRALRAASLFGLSFWHDAVQSLLGQTLAAGFWKPLLDAELLEEAGASKFPQERQLHFRHALLREGTYNTFTEEDKILGHRLAGEWLVRAGETDATTLAEHFKQGAAPQKAIAQYSIAAEHAIGGNDLEGALQLTQRGRLLGAQGEQLGSLLLLEALAHNWRAEFNLAKENSEQALQLLPKGKDLWCRAAAEAVVAYGRSGAFDLLEQLGEQLLQLGYSQHQHSERFLTAASRAVGRLILAGKSEPVAKLLQLVEDLAKNSSSAASRAWLSVARAASSILQGDLSRYLFHMEAAVTLFESIGDRRNACMQSVDVSFAQNLLGDYAKAYGTCLEILEVSTQMRLRRVEAINYLHLIQSLLGLGNLTEGLQVARKAIEILGAQHDISTQGSVHTEYGLLLMQSGEDSQAEQELLLALAKMPPSYPHRPKALAALSTLKRSQGHLQEALHFAKEALSFMKEGRDFVEAFVRYAHIEALEETGQRKEAIEALRLARDRVFLRANRIEDPAQRKTFLESVPEHQRLLSLAIAWGI